MRSFVVAVALLTCACGDVQKVPDAAVVDAYVPDSPMEVTCGTGEMSCNGTCANVMTSDVFCGNCNTQCTPTQGCLNGSCVDKASRCSSIRLWNPSATDGVYFNPNTGVNMFCDFTANQTIDDIMIYNFQAPPAGYNMMRATDFNGDAVLRRAFIALYNQQGGIRSYSTWVSANCCFSTTGGLDLHFGGIYIYPGIGATVTCSPPEGYITGHYYTFGKSNAAAAETTLPDTYFTTNPVTEVALCSDQTNPAFFYKRHFGLN